MVDKLNSYQRKFSITVDPKTRQHSVGFRISCRSRFLAFDIARHPNQESKRGPQLQHLWKQGLMAEQVEWLSCALRESKERNKSIGWTFMVLKMIGEKLQTDLMVDRQFVGVGLGSIKSCPKCMLAIRSEDKERNVVSFFRFIISKSGYVLYLHSEQTKWLVKQQQSVPVGSNTKEATKLYERQLEKSSSCRRGDDLVPACVTYLAVEIWRLRRSPTLYANDQRWKTVKVQTTLAITILGFFSMESNRYKQVIVLSRQCIGEK